MYSRRNYQGNGRGQRVVKSQPSMWYTRMVKLCHIRFFHLHFLSSCACLAPAAASQFK